MKMSFVSKFTLPSTQKVCLRQTKNCTTVQSPGCHNIMKKVRGLDWLMLARCTVCWLLNQRFHANWWHLIWLKILSPCNYNTIWTDVDNQIKEGKSRPAWYVGSLHNVNHITWQKHASVTQTKKVDSLIGKWRLLWTSYWIFVQGIF